MTGPVQNQNLKRPPVRSLRTYWDLLEPHLRPQRARFIGLLFLMLGNIGLQLLNPQIMRSFIDEALAASPLSQLMIAAAAYIGIALAQQVVSVGVAYQGENVAWTATNELRAELARHCLNLDMSFHNKHTPGELIERINGDVGQVANFFSTFIINLTGNLLLLAGILGVLYFEDWRAGLVFSFYAAVAVLLLNYVRDLAINDWKSHREASAHLTSFIEEQLSGTEDIRSSGAAGFVIRELYRLQTAIFHLDRKASGKNLVINFVIGLLLTLGNGLAIGSGYFLFKANLITIGTVYLFVRYISLLEAPIWALSHEMQNFQSIGACVERLHELRQIQPAVLDGERDVSIRGPLDLVFDQVSFSYEDGDPVLQKLSFQLKPGMTLGLLGRTGSGKTTLARLVFRLYDPTGGCITLHGVDLRANRVQTLRKQVALVTQEVQIFRASVRDNLTFFDRTIPDQRILDALFQLELQDWLASLPNGLETELEEGGRGLSAGEAQLLALVRVFLTDPGLVILDEASSRLDPATEQRIEHSLDRLLAGRSAIIIAHRLKTVQRVDEILILEDGNACEYGPRGILAGDPNSRFYHLLQTGLEEVLV